LSQWALRREAEAQHSHNDGAGLNMLILHGAQHNEVVHFSEMFAIVSLTV
jgi:hypothetical protein